MQLLSLIHIQMCIRDSLQTLLTVTYFRHSLLVDFYLIILYISLIQLRRNSLTLTQLVDSIQLKQPVDREHSQLCWQNFCSAAISDRLFLKHYTDVIKNFYSTNTIRSITLRQQKMYFPTEYIVQTKVQNALYSNSTSSLMNYKCLLYKQV